MPLNDFQKIMLDRHVWKCCLNCAYWEPNVAAMEGRVLGVPEMCSKAGALPPASIVVTGCEQWEDDIPF